VLGREVVQAPDPMYAQLRGMAALAGVALGAHRLEDLGALLPPGRRFEPDARASRVYDQLAPVFTVVYGAEKKTLRGIRRATRP